MSNATNEIKALWTTKAETTLMCKHLSGAISSESPNESSNVDQGTLKYIKSIRQELSSIIKTTYTFLCIDLVNPKIMHYCQTTN